MNKYADLKRKLADKEPVIMANIMLTTSPLMIRAFEN